MKYVILLVNLILIGSRVNAQGVKPLAKAEEVLATSGALLEKQFYDIGKVKGIEVQILRVKNLSSKVEFNAVRLSYTYRSQYSSDEKIATLDAEEMDGLLKSMDYILNITIKENKTTYSEVVFTSRTGTRVGVYYDLIAEEWKAFVEIDKYKTNSSVFFGTNSLQELYNVFVKANEELSRP